MTKEAEARIRSPNSASSFGFRASFVIRASSFRHSPSPPSPVSCTLYLCSPPAKSSVPADGSPPGCPTTSTAASNSPWPRPSIGRSASGSTWWSRRAPAWARASPTSCRPSWPPPAAAKRQPRADEGRRGDRPTAATDSPRPRRVVVSTHTISLQEQLMQKDMPLLQQRDSAGVLGGAGQGAGQLPQPAAAGQRPEPGRQPVQRRRGVRAIAAARAPGRKQTADGSLADLDFRPLPAVWDEVASDHGNCMGRSCPMYAKCFYYKARRRMQNAQILVVNHALFFTDLALRRENVSILPKYDVVIFDEAHTIEAVAGDHLGLSITSGQVEYTLRKLYNDRTNRGLLVHHKLRDAQKEVWECRDRAGDFFESVAAWLAEQPGRSRQRPRVLAQAAASVAQLRSSEALRSELVATLRRARPSRSNSPKSGRTSPPRPTGWRRSPRASTIGWASRCPTRCIGSSGASAAAGCGSRWRPRRSTWGRSSASICSPRCPPW